MVPEVGHFATVLALVMAIALDSTSEEEPAIGALPAVSSSAPKPVFPVLAQGAVAAVPARAPLDILAPDESVIYHQYVDELGHVRFAASLLEVPEQWRDRVGRVELAGTPPATPAEARMLRKLQRTRSAD